MRLVDNTGHNGSKNRPVGRSETDGAGMTGQSECIDAAICVMTSIVETACESSTDLDLMQLVNFMDLYRVYLTLASDPQSELHRHVHPDSGSATNTFHHHTLGGTEVVSFERFVKDSALLNLAAIAASHESGERVNPPLPLTIVANS